MRRVGRGELLWTLPAVLPFLAAVGVLAVPREFPRLLLGHFFGSAAAIGMVTSVIVIWRRTTGAGLRWFWAGAAVWAVAVLLKYVLAGLGYAPLLVVTKAHLSHFTYLALGLLVGGLLTGICEGGITLLAGLKWRRLARDGNRAAAVGIGAGAVEALFTGLPVFLPMALAVIGSGFLTAAERSEFVSNVRNTTTSAAWLALPVERTLALLVHTGFRLLVLLTVASGRWRYFWYGFLLSTAIDGAAAYFDLAGQVETISVWWIELALAPFAVVSVPIIIWCLRHWPAAQALPSAEAGAAPSLAP